MSSLSTIYAFYNPDAAGPRQQTSLRHGMPDDRAAFLDDSLEEARRLRDLGRAPADVRRSILKLNANLDKPLPPLDLCRQRLRVSRRGSMSRHYIIEELASGLTHCECQGFAVRGRCKHVDAAQAVGLIGRPAR
jgi:hypothetical protein